MQHSIYDIYCLERLVKHLALMTKPVVPTRWDRVCFFWCALLKKEQCLVAKTLSFIESLVFFTSYISTLMSQVKILKIFSLSSPFSFSSLRCRTYHKTNPPASRKAANDIHVTGPLLAYFLKTSSLTRSLLLLDSARTIVNLWLQTDVWQKRLCFERVLRF